MDSENKFAKQDYTLTAYGSNNRDKIIIDRLSPHNIDKLYLADSLIIVQTYSILVKGAGFYKDIFPI